MDASWISQTPAIDAPLIGRHGQLDALVDLLETKHHPSLVLLYGDAGIGKTTLARHCALRLLARGAFPDGICFLSASMASDAAHLFQQALGEIDPQWRQLETCNIIDLAKTAAALLKERSVLFVLDDINDASLMFQVALPLSQSGAKVLVIQRYLLPALSRPDAEIRRIGSLAAGPSRQLLVRAMRRCGWRPQGRERRSLRKEIEDALRWSQGNPLALIVAGATLARAGVSLSQAIGAESVRNPQGRTVSDGMTPDPSELTSLLLGREPGDIGVLATALASFSCPNLPSAIVEQIAIAVGMPQPTDSVLRLVDLGVLNRVPAPGLNQWESDTDLALSPAIRASLNHQLSERSSDTASAIRNTVARCSVAAVSGPLLSKRPDDTLLLEILRWAGKQHETQLVRDACLRLKEFWDRRLRAAESLQYLPLGVSAAVQEYQISSVPEDLLAVADLALTCGLMARRVGEHARAEEMLRINLDARRKLKDRLGEGYARAKVGNIALRRGALEDARSYYQEALTIADEMRDKQLRCEALRYLGRVAQRSAALAESIALYEESLTLADEILDSSAGIWILAYLGSALQSSGRIEEALRRYDDALRRARDMRDRQAEGFVLSFFADTELTMGLTSRAEATAEQSLELLVATDDRPTIPYVIMFLGQLRQAVGDSRSAVNLLSNSIRLFQELQDSEGEIQARAQLAAFLP